MDYKYAFQRIGPLCGQHTASALSPDGRLLLFSNAEGHLCLFNNELGAVLGVLQLGHDHRITSMEWVNSFQAIFGNAVGEIKTGDLSTSSDATGQVSTHYHNLGAFNANYKLPRRRIPRLSPSPPQFDVALILPSSHYPTTLPETSWSMRSRMRCSF